MGACSEKEEWDNPEEEKKRPRSSHSDEAKARRKRSCEVAHACTQSEADKERARRQNAQVIREVADPELAKRKAELSARIDAKLQVVDEIAGPVVGRRGSTTV